MFARVRPYLSTGVIALLIAYFVANALTGDRGLLTDKARDAALAQRTQALTRMVAERKDLEVRTRLLGDGHLSKDLLEERARTLLGFADPRDYVIRTARPASSAAQVAIQSAEVPTGG